MPDLALTSLDDLALIGVRGPDARAFLQGQVAQDLERLDAAGGALLAGLHNPQGRCLALLRVWRVADDQLLLVLPADLAESVRTLLTRYVLRAKVRLEDANTSWRVYGATGPDAGAAASTRLSMAMDDTGLRQMIIAPRSEPFPDGDRVERAIWRRDDITDGVPEIGLATSGQFVAQMLNLDLIDALSFNKGCYTGQEVIARAHYRGQVKRRMQRFFTDAQIALLPATRVRLGDGRSAQIVMSAPLEEGGQEFLAVTTTAALNDAETTGAAFADTTDLSPDEILLGTTQLPLPYALP